MEEKISINSFFKIERIKKIKKEIIKKIKNETLSGLLGAFIKCFALLGAGLLAMYIFFRYVFNMYFLNYWKIDDIFNVNHSFANLLIYLCFIILILAIIMITLLDQKTIRKKVKLFIYFFIIVLVTGNNFSFTFGYFFNHFVLSLIAYCYCIFIDKKIRIFVETNSNVLINKIYSIRTEIVSILLIPVSIFIAVASFALLFAYFQNEYKIIRENNVVSQVVLYSTKDYYIVAECEEKNNILYINSNIQQKISTNDLITEIIEFDKVERIESKS